MGAIMPAQTVLVKSWVWAMSTGLTLRGWSLTGSMGGRGGLGGHFCGVFGSYR